MKNEIAVKERTMTTKEIAEVLGVSKNRVQESAKRIFPNRMIHGHVTYWNEYEVSEISKELKSNQRAPNLTVGSSQQLPSTQLEVAESMSEEHEKELLEIKLNESKYIIRKLLDAFCNHSMTKEFYNEIQEFLKGDKRK